MSGLTIRDARDGDREAMRDVTLAAYEQYAAVMPPWAWQEYREGMIEAVTAQDPAERIVAERDGAIVGSVILYPAGTEVQAPDSSAFTFTWPEVRLLAVAPTARGQGIGQALVEECIARARGQGAEAITLHTADMMQTAMQMYERMGFERFPELDFTPAENVIIKGYRYNLQEATQSG